MSLPRDVLLIVTHLAVPMITDISHKAERERESVSEREMICAKSGVSGHCITLHFTVPLGHLFRFMVRWETGGISTVEWVPFLLVPWLFWTRGRKLRPPVGAEPLAAKVSEHVPKHSLNSSIHSVPFFAQPSNPRSLHPQTEILKTFPLSHSLISPQC